jgi:hypothetical protein
MKNHPIWSPDHKLHNLSFPDRDLTSTQCCHTNVDIACHCKPRDIIYLLGSHTKDDIIFNFQGSDC